MALSLLGILSAAGAGGAAPAGGGGYELISSTILGTDTATVSFSSIPQDFKHLEIRAVSANVDSGSSIAIRLNSDSGNNYAYHFLGGNGTSVTSSNATSTDKMFIYAHSNNADSGWGSGVVSILDYANTSKNKTIRSLGGSTANNSIRLFSGFRNNTEAVTSITLLDVQSFNIRTGSRFSLYGIKGE